MARLFDDIVPLVTTIRSADGMVEHDDQLMYSLSDEAVAAFNEILEPHGRSAAWYMESLKLRSPGFRIWVALRQEYDIADYVIAQRAKIGGPTAFRFTYYDSTMNPDDPKFRPKAACFLFDCRSALEVAVRVIPFLKPALSVIPDQPTSLPWLVLLDEDPAHVLAEAGSMQSR